MFHHINRGTCSRAIDLEIRDGIITHCEFIGGCAGNTKGISQLVVGCNAEEVAKRLEGTTCGMKPTSCPDQLAQAIRAYHD